MWMTGGPYMTMTETLDNRLSLLEAMARDDGVVVVLDNISQSIYYIDGGGDYHRMSYRQYLSVKDKVTVIRLDYAKVGDL